MRDGPYRSPAEPQEVKPSCDREALAVLALLAVVAVVPLVGDLVSGAPLGGGAGLGMLVVAASSRAAWGEARRARGARQTPRRRGRTR